MNIDVELVNLRLRLSGEKTAFDLPEWQAGEDAPVRTTTVYGCEEAVNVLARDSLAAGQCIDGPVLITEATSTTWIDQHWQASIDRWGNILLNKK
jgi:N-methylhydantoinase A/oxoprolinase/acetone carboxylase beta subunit